jgi:hypothetical protein
MAENPDSEELAVRLTRSRAVEAVIWGMPAVSMAAIRRSLSRDLDAGFGDVIYFSNVMEPRHEFLTANNQTPYVLTFFDLTDGPWVMDVPAASPKVLLFGSAIDSWEVPLVDVGATGQDGGRGGRYLFLPPDQHEAHAEGFIVVPSPTRYVHVGLRPITRGAGTLADAVAYSRQLRTYRLANADHPPAVRYIDAYPKAWHTLPTFDLDFLRLVTQVVDEEPAQEKDAVMLGMLAGIGIERGRPFGPTGDQADLLSSAVAEGAAHMNDYFLSQAFERHWEDRQWLKTKPEDNFGFSFHGDGKLDYDRRAGAFTYWATWAPKRLGDPSKLPASYYVKGFRDGSGDRFRGDHLYRLRIPTDTPAQDFWSIVVYEVGTNAFIHNEQGRVGISSHDRDQLTVEDDGSINVYVGPQAPDGLEQNWIPTAGRDFWLIFRFYGPQLSLFDKAWTADDVVRVS